MLLLSPNRITLQAAYKDKHKVVIMPQEVGYSRVNSLISIFILFYFIYVFIYLDR